jgi:tRNA A-37 threonylcarbamoyl transferase component Bud32
MQDRMKKELNFLYSELNKELSSSQLILEKATEDYDDFIERTIIEYKIKIYANEATALDLNIEPLIMLLVGLKALPPSSKTEVLKYLREKIIPTVTQFHENPQQYWQTKNKMNFKQSIVPRITLDDLLFSFPAMHDGTNSSVYKAKWQGKRVVVKCVEIEDPEEKNDYINERNIMHNLTQLKAGFVIGLLGYYVPEEPELGYLVMEFMEAGDLLSYMKKNTLSLDYYFIARKIALGVGYLHQYNVYHCDLKPENILIDADNNPRIADFGLAQRKKDISAQPEFARGTDGYIAAELMEGKPCTPATEVYALGITFFSFFNRCHPYPSHMNAKKIFDSTMEGKRPEFTPLCPKDVHKLIKRCWDQNPSHRPTVKQVVHDMDELIVAKI